MPPPTPENPPFNPNHNAFIPSIDPYIPFAPGGSLQARPMPVSFSDLWRAAKSRDNTLFDRLSPKLSALAAEDFTSNIHHFLRRHGLDPDQEAAVSKDMHDIQAVKIDGQLYTKSLEVNAGEEYDPLTDRKRPFMRAWLETPLQTGDNKVLMRSAEPVISHTKLNVMVVDKNLSPLTSASNQDPLQTTELDANAKQLICIHSCHYTWGDQKTAPLVAVTPAETSESWMAMHLLQDPTIKNDAMLI
jgi:hypothetical protein